MKKTKITYNYDAALQMLCIVKNNKPFGGFRGEHAEREFSRLLETGADITLTDMGNSIKSARIRRLRAMWVKQGIDQYRESILEPYGVTSTADLTIEQLDELIEKYAIKKEVTERTRTLRSNVLITLDKLGIYADNGDWQRVNAFLMLPRIAGKMIYQMSDDELITLNKKLRAILDKKGEIDADVNRRKMLN